MPIAFDRLVDLPGGPVRVRVRGEGPPLLWSHGVFFPLAVDDESAIGRVLGDVPGFTVVRWDARGHGLTPPAPTPDDHRWDRLADDLLALADALGFERFAAGGVSMGTVVTLHAAVKAPERVAAMLLLAMPTAWETRPAEKQRYRELLELGSPEAIAAQVEGHLAELFPGDSAPASLRRMVAYLGAKEWRTLEAVILGASESDMPDKEHLARLHVPTLLRPWPNDAGHPLTTARILASELPDADYAELESFDDEAGVRAGLAALLGACSGVQGAVLPPG